MLFFAICKLMLLYMYSYYVYCVHLSSNIFLRKNAEEKKTI